jgi:hypothetical protein
VTGLSFSHPAIDKEHSKMKTISLGLPFLIIVSCAPKPAQLGDPPGANEITPGTYAGRCLHDAGFRETRPGQYQIVIKPAGTVFVEVLSSETVQKNRLSISDRKSIWVKTDHEGYFRFSTHDYVVEFPRRPGHECLFYDIKGNFVGSNPMGPDLRVSTDVDQCNK